MHMDHMDHRDYKGLNPIEKKLIYMLINKIPRV